MKGKRITATRMKLQEAEFFLGLLDDAYYDDVRQMFDESKKPPVFQYYLSAFLSAARSITWIMRSEYQRLPGWEEWYQSQEPAENAGLLKLFNELRVRSEKIAPVTPGHELRFEGDGGPVVERDSRMPHFRVTITSADPSSDGRLILSGDVLEWKWTIDELDGGDLLDACRRYLHLISKLLSDCEDHFSLAGFQ